MPESLYNKKENKSVYPKGSPFFEALWLRADFMVVIEEARRVFLRNQGVL